jgi:hypothetical protein
MIGGWGGGVGGMKGMGRADGWHCSTESIRNSVQAQVAILYAELGLSRGTRRNMPEPGYFKHSFAFFWPLK